MSMQLKGLIKMVGGKWLVIPGVYYCIRTRVTDDVARFYQTTKPHWFRCVLVSDDINMCFRLHSGVLLFTHRPWRCGMHEHLCEKHTCVCERCVRVGGKIRRLPAVHFCWDIFSLKNDDDGSGNDDKCGDGDSIVTTVSIYCFLVTVSADSSAFSPHTHTRTHTHTHTNTHTPMVVVQPGDSQVLGARRWVRRCSPSGFC